jgi:epoxyqueuosine reductase
LPASRPFTPNGPTEVSKEGFEQKVAKEKVEDKSTKERVVQLAEKCGFDACGFTRAEVAVHRADFLDWIEHGLHADMDWLARAPERRTDPRAVLCGCKSVIVLARNYYQGDEVRKRPGRIARYAFGSDYHSILLDDMEPVAAFLEDHGGTQKCYVDTGPVLERDFAASAGIGWYGKSTMCLNERLGTWFFLGAILTTLAFESDTPAKNRCGSCTRCISACPTQAIAGPYQLDARRCISYLTIENEGAIPLELRRLIGDRIYGCDDCLEACPWNRFAQISAETRFRMPSPLRRFALRDLAALNEEEFRVLFRGSPIKRIKHRRFIRNVCVALGNVGTEDDLPILGSLAKHADTLIAEHAQWAASEVENRSSPSDLALSSTVDSELK